MAKVGIVDIDILSNAVIVGGKINQGMNVSPSENSHFSLMMDVLLMILCRTIQSGNQVPQDESSD